MGLKSLAKHACTIWCQGLGGWGVPLFFPSKPSNNFEPKNKGQAIIISPLQKVDSLQCAFVLVTQIIQYEKRGLGIKGDARSISHFLRKYLQS